MAQTFGQNNVPGMQAAIETEEKQVLAAVLNGNNPVTTYKATIDSTAADSGNSPTTTLRAGNVMGVKDADGNAYLYDPDGDDGSQLPVGILGEYQNMLQNGAAADRFTKLLTGGVVKLGELLGEDYHARSVLHQMGFRLVGDTIGPLGHEFLVHQKMTKQITSGDLSGGAYTVTAAENGTLFIAEGADTNFTLPTIAHGLAYEFLMSTNHEIVLTGSNNIIALNDSAASTLTATTTAEQIGVYWRARAVYMGSTPALRWLVENLGIGAPTIAIA